MNEGLNKKISLIDDNLSLRDKEIASLEKGVKKLTGVYFFGISLLLGIAGYIVITL